MRRDVADVNRAPNADREPKDLLALALPKVLLTPARIDDAERIFTIETEAFAQPWQRQAIIDELANPDAWHQIARNPTPDGSRLTIAGYILVRFLTDEMHIMKLAVDSRWRQMGIATALLEAAQTEAMRRAAAVMLLEVRPSNRAAIRFYQKAGFRTIGIRSNYYPNTGEDALVMSKRFKEEP